eukprot:m.87938 g.87938  ORF g.87938 m.87938 type:complete len:196 (-) comp8476_c0_seq3:189-776(-)
MQLLDLPTASAHLASMSHKWPLGDPKLVQQSLAFRLLMFALLLSSTPTCSHLPANMAGVTEIHPGNYFCYDTMMVNISACQQEQIALKVAARVTGCYPSRREFCIDAGWTALGAQGQPEDYWILGHPEWKVRSISQECAVVCVADDEAADISQFPIGTMVFVLPFHACAVCACHTKLFVTSDGQVCDTWDIAAHR